MKRVTLTRAIRVNGTAHKAGDTIEVSEADYRMFRARRRGGRPMIEPLDDQTDDANPVADFPIAGLTPRRPVDTTRPYMRAEPGALGLEPGSRDVLFWEDDTAVQFRCPCDERLVYVTSPPHTIKFAAAGVLTIDASCGYREDPKRGRPKNWCHFWIKGGMVTDGDRPGLCSDSKCPGRPGADLPPASDQDNIQAVHRLDKAGDLFTLSLGEYFFGREVDGDTEYDVIYMRHPRSTTPCRLPLNVGKTKDRGDTWQWDGNRDCPTLKPSISHRKPGGWHGYLTAGRFVLHSINASYA